MDNPSVQQLFVRVDETYLPGLGLTDTLPCLPPRPPVLPPPAPPPAFNNTTLNDTTQHDPTLKQLRALSVRLLRNTYRHPFSVALNFAATLAVAVCLGLIFRNSGEEGNTHTHMPQRGSVCVCLRTESPVCVYVVCG